MFPSLRNTRCHLAEVLAFDSKRRSFPGIHLILLNQDLPRGARCWDTPGSRQLSYSVRSAFTGLESAVFIACMLTVASAIITASAPDRAKTSQVMRIL